MKLRVVFDGSLAALANAKVFDSEAGVDLTSGVSGIDVFFRAGRPTGAKVHFREPPAEGAADLVSEADLLPEPFPLPRGSHGDVH